MLQVSTNIPSVAVKSADNEAGVIEITDVKTSFDGGDNKAFGWIDTSTDYATIMVLNTYNSNVGTETIPFAIPEKSIAITFTVSGMAMDAVIEEAAGSDDAADTKGDFNTTALIACIVAGAVIIAAAAILGVVLGKSKKADAEETVEEAPVEETVEEAPVEETVEEAPVEETVEEAPVEETVEEAPVEEAAAEEAPAEEAAAEETTEE